MDRGNERFEQCYRCYSVSFINKAHLEKGDKVIMPPSALDRLASLHVDFPLLFELTNAPVGRVSHCGVLEFVADEGLMYLPHWMMENLLLEEGDIVLVKSASLAKATYVKLQPHTMDFLDISNPKAILEITLRSYSCLTVGDTIMVPYNDKKYYIDIVEAKPSPAVSVIETDCEVDFAPPLDYKEIHSNKRPLEVEEELPKKIMLVPFSGSSRRLDGEPAAMPVSPLLKQNSNVGNETVASGSYTSRQQAGKLVFGSNGNHQQAGKLVFGSNGNRPQNETTKVAMRNSSQEPRREKQPVQAFTGKKYSLMG
ncbi:ubiquitin fusion degradation protein 1-like protein [Gossypium australe]|uniref:Ubiquitin fusion degradation protein 1-like protein n=1 Tax=Gossypium australe TaxID=47621 RepID=A0A5B6UIN6_9ROSI|nr:ubiquitin fusion degradation protein 1-like protein [Gossypium australe]